MYFKNKLSGNMVPVVHANGPAKMEKQWDDAVNTYFKEAPCKGEMSKDITVITWSIPEEETLLENCFKQLNLLDRLIVIPMKTPFNFLDKIRKMYKYLSLVKTKYVMALDATDVMVLGYDAVDEVLRSFQRKEARCVFSAEIPQWPNIETGQGIMAASGDAPFELGAWKTELTKIREYEEVYEWLGSPFKHLCSGAWIGEREYMIDFYKECMDIIPEGWWDENLFGGDQGFITLVAGRRFPDVLLDYKSEMFLSLSGTTEKEVEINIEPQKALYTTFYYRYKGRHVAAPQWRINMEESDMKQVISFFSDEEVKVVWKEEDKTKVGRGKITHDDDNFVYLAGEKGKVIVNKKDIIAIKQ